MIRPVVRLRPRSVEDASTAVRAQARRQVRAELDQIGEAWVAKVTEIVQAEYPRRDDARHRPNTTHLDVSFQHRVIEGPDGGFPMRVELTTKPGVSAAKVGALNYGVDREYTIAARNAKSLRWGEAPGDIRTPGQKSVTWKPGPKARAGGRFLERARDSVLASRRRSV